MKLKKMLFDALLLRLETIEFSKVADSMVQCLAQKELLWFMDLEGRVIHQGVNMCLEKRIKLI